MSVSPPGAGGRTSCATGYPTDATGRPAIISVQSDSAIGAAFDASRWADRPGFVYSDSNVRQTARDAPSGEVAALRSFEREQVFARERAVYAGASAVFVMSDYLRRSMVTDFG